MTGSTHIEKHSVAPSNTLEVLPEGVRQEYLSAMGIQTWYDPTLEFKDVANQAKISNQVTSSVTNAVVVDAVSVTSSAEESNKILESLNQDTEKKSVQTLSIESPSLQVIDTSSIDLLNTAIDECQLCELHATRQHAICGEGNVAADLMIVTSAPVNEASSAEEVLFSEAHKEFMQLVLQAIDISFPSVYLTSLVKCKPPEQRAPFTSEMICCDDHLTNQIKLIQPKVIMVLGESASQQLLVSQKSLTDLRLRRHQHLGVPVYASYHPQDIIGSVQNKRKVWQDLLQIKNQLNKQVET